MIKKSSCSLLPLKIYNLLYLKLVNIEVKTTKMMMDKQEDLFFDIQKNLMGDI